MSVHFRLSRLEKKVSRYKKFEDYLLRVIDVMPEDYLAASDDKMKGLMSRHRTLSDSNVHLVNKLESMSDEVKPSNKINTEFILVWLCRK